MLRLLEMLLVRWTGLARRSGWIGVLAILAAAGAAAWYAAGNLRVNTDTSAMLDPNLPFQQRAADLKAAFPEIKSDILIIVRAPTLDETEAFTAALRTRLVARDDQFSGVFAPSADPFFLENGLLYLGERDLESRLTQLTKAAGLIEKLVAQPTAGVFFDALAENDALVEDADLGRDTLDAIYADLVAVIDASVAGATRPFAWMGALGVDEAPLGGHSRLIYATPSLDYARLQPAKAALNALAAEINTLSDEFDGRVETFVTGDPALRADELSAVTKGLGLSFALSFALVAALLLLAFRSAYLAAATLVSLIITIVLTAAFAAAAVGELNLV